MSLDHRTVTDREAAFADILALLSESYAMLDDVNYWSFCRFASWATHTAPEDLAEHLHQWRLASGKLAGIALVDGGRDTHVITQPAHRELESEIYAWIEAEWPTKHNRWVAYAEANDNWRQATLTALSYRPDGEAEYMHKYDLQQVALEPDLQPGFRIQDMTEDCDALARARLKNLVFNPGRELPQNFKSRTHLTPYYEPALDLTIIAPNGAPVAFAIGWVDPVTKSAEVEPVGTHPDYRQRGLAKAVTTETFRRLKSRGATVAHIASAPKPNISNYLYEGLGPVSKLRFVRWVKEQDQSDP